MNNKGFAISGILYGFLLLFLMILLSILHVLVIRIDNLSDLIDDVDKVVEDNGCVSNVSVAGCETANYYDYEDYHDSAYNYITKVRGIYTLTVTRNDYSTDKCVLFLPRDIDIFVTNNKIKYTVAQKDVNGNYVIDLEHNAASHLSGYEIPGYNCGNVMSFNVDKVNSSVYNK